MIVSPARRSGPRPRSIRGSWLRPLGVGAQRSSIPLQYGFFSANARRRRHPARPTPTAATLPSDVGRPDRSSYYSCPPALRARGLGEPHHRHRWVFGNASRGFLSSPVPSCFLPDGRANRGRGTRRRSNRPGSAPAGRPTSRPFPVPTVTAGRPTFLLFPVSGTTHILCNSAAFGTSPSPSTPIDSSDAANAARG